MIHNLHDIQHPIGFALFGVARTMPGWIDMSGRILHIGPGEKHIADTSEIEWPEYDADFDDIPFPDGSVGGIIATHVLEHLEDPRFLLREAGRVLAEGAPFNILVPHAQALIYAQDLDHKTPFVIETWKTLLDSSYYTKEKDGFPFTLGANFLFGLKEENLCVVTQLIRKSRDDDAY